MMKTNSQRLLFVLLLFISMYINASQPQVIGWIEPVTLMPENFRLQAKIDTGADNSSIDAANWESFHKDGVEWIRFSVTSNDDRKADIEKPLLRYTSVKRKRAEPVERPVVEMDLCIGGVIIQAPVNLADRGNYSYRMLIGRSALEGHFLVDSSRKNTVTATCVQ